MIRLSRARTRDPPSVHGESIIFSMSSHETKKAMGVVEFRLSWPVTGGLKSMHAIRVISVA
jgi:hypothetical protein